MIKRGDVTVFCPGTHQWYTVGVIFPLLLSEVGCKKYAKPCYYREVERLSGSVKLGKLFIVLNYNSTQKSYS